MGQIPLYLKTDPEMPRPKDPEFYWLTRDGMFFCRNHPFFSSDVPARRLPRSLAQHESACSVRYPKLGIAALEFIIGFFDRVYELHGSESIVLLLWNTQRRRYKLCVPEQQATVWESYSGVRSAMDVTYKVPVDLPPHFLLVGDIHCHADIAAYASYTDQKDERYRDGVHAIVGRIEREPPEIHLEMSVDGHRFPLKLEDFIRGYRHRRRIVPGKWLEKLKVKVDRATWSGWSSSYSSSSDRSWNSPKKNRWD